MTITAVNGPTRGPDHALPVVNRGTAKVTAPAAVSAVATESPFSAMPAVIDLTAVIAPKKKTARPLNRMASPRSLTASMAIILMPSPEIAAESLMAHLAVQAYQSQRRADGEEPEISPGDPRLTGPPSLETPHRDKGFDVAA